MTTFAQWKAASFRTLAMMSILGIPLAHAQQSAGGGAAPSKVTTVVYQDWGVRCEAPSASASERSCEASQIIPAEDHARLLIRRITGEDRFRLAVELPNGIWLPVGVSMFTDDKGSVLPLTFKRCTQFCLADIDLGLSQVRELRDRTGKGRLEFQRDEGSYATLPFSWQGFAQAIDALFKR